MSELIKAVIEAVEPTAPRAIFPTYLPTIIESVRLYACWNKFPIKSGIANSKSNNIGSPLSYL